MKIIQLVRWLLQHKPDYSNPAYWVNLPVDVDYQLTFTELQFYILRYNNWLGPTVSKKTLKQAINKLVNKKLISRTIDPTYGSIKFKTLVRLTDSECVELTKETVYDSKRVNPTSN